jgi:hypothetical protein
VSAATGAATDAAGAPGVKSLKTEPVTPYRTAGRPADGKKTAGRPALAKPAPPPAAAAAAAGTVHQQDLTRRVSTRSKKPGRAQVFFYSVVYLLYCGYFATFICRYGTYLVISSLFKFVPVPCGTKFLWPTKQCCGSETVWIEFIVGNFVIGV